MRSRCCRRVLVRVLFHVRAIGFAVVVAFAFIASSSLDAQNQNSQKSASTSKTAGSAKETELKAAQKPKSDKWTFSMLPFGLQRNPAIDYIVITEMTEAGRKLPKPSFAKPVYYQAHSVGQHDVGDAYGGTKAITYDRLRKQLGDALASNGYRPADAEHPPTQLFIIAWGMHNKIDNTIDDGSGEMSDTGDMGGSEDMSGSLDMTTGGMDDETIQNILSRAKVVGGQKFANEFARALADQLAWSTDFESSGPMKRFTERDETTETLVYEIMNECYYFIVTSIDMETLKRGEGRKVLWTTHISTTSQGIAFEATLPNMINNGAYYFGREMESPDVIRKRAYKQGTVEIGEATVVEYVTGTTGTTGASGTTTAPRNPATTPSTNGPGSGKR